MEREGEAAERKERSDGGFRSQLRPGDAPRVVTGDEALIEGRGGDVPLRGRVIAVEQSGFAKVSVLGVEEQRVKAHIEFLDSIPPRFRLGDRFRIQVRIILRRSEGELLIVYPSELVSEGTRVTWD